MSSKKQEIGECIYCGFKGPMSDEHGWPRFFGEFEGFPHLLKHVCGGCNRRLGILEDQFSHTGDIDILRRLLDIKGRPTHKKIDSFVRGSAGAMAQRVTVADPKSGLQLLATPVPGLNGRSIGTQWLNQLVTTDSAGNEIQIPLSDGIQTLGELVSLLEESGISPPARVRWLAFGALKSVIRGVVQASAEGYEWLELEEPGRAVQNGGEFVSSVSKNRFYIYRAIAKIALDYLLASSNGSITGLELYLHAVKDYIYNGGDDSQFVTMKWESIVQMPVDTGPGSWCHLAAVNYCGGLLRVSLQFFYGPEYPHPPRYDVALALTNDVTPDFSRHGHQFVYGNSEKGTAGYVGRADPLFLSRYQHS